MRRSPAVRSSAWVPIVTMALSTGLALLLGVLRFGVLGSEIQAPLAMVIVCGLCSSTALNMFSVPAAVFMWYRPCRERVA